MMHLQVELSSVPAPLLRNAEKDLSELFHLPINEAAASLGVCATVLKKRCRTSGIKRWPHRKIKALDVMIETYQSLLHLDPSLKAEISLFQERREALRQDPNISFKTLISKHETTAFNAKVAQLTQTDVSLPSRSNQGPSLSLSISKTIAKPTSKIPRRTAGIQILGKWQEEEEVSAVGNINQSPQSLEVGHREGRVYTAEELDFQNFVESLAGKIQYQKIIPSRPFPHFH